MRPSSWQNAVQTALVPGKLAGAYEEPDHSRGEEWPGKQPETKQLSLFDTTFVTNQNNHHDTARGPSPPPRRPTTTATAQRQTSMVRFMYVTLSTNDDDDASRSAEGKSR